MKRKGLLLLLVLAASTMLFAGCDFIRTVAGRPTSEDLKVIARQKQELAEKEAQQQREEQLRQKAEADSLLAVQNLEGAMFRKMTDISRTMGLKEELPSLYCVVLGAFSSEENAKKLVEQASTAGYKAFEMPYRSGKVGVAAIPTDSYVELGLNYAKLKAEKFCPADAWVLVNK